MRRILERHDSVPEARARIARLLVEEERYDSADVLLDGLLRDDPFDPGFLALRAQSAFSNRRIAEHFARLRQARNRFPLLHPLAAYHRNDATRALDARAYGLPTARSGTIRYRAEYELARTDEVLRDQERDSLPGATSLSFERERPARDGAVVEWLDITPELLPPGRYLLRLAVRAAAGGPPVGRAQVGFEIVRR